jgi:hypothetical protein
VRTRALVIRSIRSLVVAEVLLALTLVHAGSAQPGQAQPAPAEKPPQSSGETLIIGTTTLRLGMSKDSVIPALAMQYEVIPSGPRDRYYQIMASKSSYVGDLHFNEQARLVAAEKRWLPDFRAHNEGEVGKALFGAIGDLVSNGKTACWIDASQRHSAELKGQPSKPGWVYRDATIACGQKRIHIAVPTEPDGTDSMQINEEIGKPEAELSR